MSIHVKLEDLGRVMTEYGSAVLCTLSPGPRVKVHTVDPVLEDGVLVLRMQGRGSARNLESNDQATIVWQPLARHGYTLIVDGRGVGSPDGVRVVPDQAMLHRPAAHADGPASTYP